jgi:hypothetical protein
MLKEWIRATPFYHPVRNWLRATRHGRELRRWEARGRPAPPPHIVKQNTIRTLAKRFGLNTLVETGTYYGDMVEAMKRHFSQVYSIELSRPLWERAARRFRGDRNVTIIHGDSGAELGRVVRELRQPALFYLDGHYTHRDTARGVKDTPIYEELAHIFGHGLRHVIVIDDARCFGSDPSYPSMQELRHFVRRSWPTAAIEVADDSIRILPAAAF